MQLLYQNFFPITYGWTCTWAVKICGKSRKTLYILQCSSFIIVLIWIRTIMSHTFQVIRTWRKRIIRLNPAVCETTKTVSNIFTIKGNRAHRYFTTSWFIGADFSICMGCNLWFCDLSKLSNYSRRCLPNYRYCRNQYARTYTCEIPTVMIRTKRFVTGKALTLYFVCYVV